MSEAGAAVGAQYRLLGPLEVVRDGLPVELGGPKQRVVLALLLLEAGRVVSADRLADAVWGDDQPPSAAASLQAYVSNLRRILRDDERATSPIVRRAPGYLIEVPAGTVDVTRFSAAAGAVEAAIGRGDWAAAVGDAEQALALWRGPLLVDHADQEWVRTAAAPLLELRATCEQNLVVGLLGTSRVAAAVARSRQLIDEQPTSERACWLHVVALHRAGRTADALDRLREHATYLDLELGLGIGPALRDLQSAVLRQDAGLSSWPVVAAAAVPEVVQPDRGSPTDEPPAPAVSDLVGRVRELSVVTDLLERSGTDGLRWAVLTGPAGIGKTRLADEVATGWARTRGRVARAGCPEDEGVPPWWPFRQVLRAIGTDPDALLTPPEGVDTDAARFAVYDAVSVALARALSDGPLLIVVEDVHWADRSSLRLLTHLAAASASTLVGLGVLVTIRDDEGGPEVDRLLAALARHGGARRIALPPLTTVEVGELAGRISGEHVDGREAALLTTRTGGNPFFVAEYARLSTAERQDGGLPLAVRSVLGRRLSVLDPAVLQVLRTAAVIGDTLEIDLLARVTRLDRDELADLLDEAADEHVIVPSPGTGAYMFAHALLRDEIAAGLSPMRRQRLHLRVAAALGPGGGTDALVRRAAQLVAAGPLADPQDVLDACRAAALDAERHWQSDGAARWWQHSLTAFDALPAGAHPDLDHDRDELVIAQVAALARAGRGQTVLDVIDAALLDAVRRDRLDSAGRLASTLLRTSGSWPWAVHGSDPAPLLARLAGVESLADDHPAAHARVLAALAVGSCYDPDPQVPDRLSRRAVDLAETLDDPDVLADALLARALTFSGLAARAAESIELLERLGSLAHRDEQVDEVISHGLLYLATMALGDTTAAAEHVRFGELGSDLLRLATSRVQFRWAAASLTLLHGDDLAGAEVRFGRALELHQQTELYESGVFDVAMLTLRWEQGRLTSAEFADINDRAVPWAAAVCAAAERDPRAAQLLADELDRPEPPVWTTHGRLTMLANAVADAGAGHLAPALLARLRPFESCLANIGQVGVAGPVALAAARLALLIGDTDDARRLLGVGRRLAERAGSRGALLRCRLLAARLDGIDGVALATLTRDAAALGMLGVAAEARRLSPVTSSS